MDFIGRYTGFLISRSAAPLKFNGFSRSAATHDVWVVGALELFGDVYTGI
jgi:hypothetical protein